MSDSVARHLKTFTLDEANQLIPKVRTHIKELQRLRHTITDANEELDRFINKVSQDNKNSIESVRDQIQILIDKQRKDIEVFKSEVLSIEKLGCRLKSFGDGVIDFRTIKDGVESCLCWKLGEDHIQFWHSMEESFTNRRSLN